MLTDRLNEHIDITIIYYTTYLSEFPRKIFYWIKIHGQLININEVTDFRGGFNS